MFDRVLNTSLTETAESSKSILKCEKYSMKISAFTMKYYYLLKQWSILFQECSVIGRDILENKGSAVDAAVASLFCIGLLNMHSGGIGGGGFLNFYNRTEKKTYIYDFREVAPLSANETMYVNASKTASTRGEIIRNRKFHFLCSVTLIY